MRGQIKLAVKYYRLTKGDLKGLRIKVWKTLKGDYVIMDVRKQGPLMTCSEKNYRKFLEEMGAEMMPF